jgi:uncharacterized damage-inducible protein DinB
VSDPFLISLFEHKAWCNDGLCRALLAAPAVEDRRAWAVVLLTFEHTHIVDHVFRARLEGRTPDETSTVGVPRVPDLEALRQAMAETDAWYLDYVRAASPADLQAPIDFAYVDDGAPGRMTRGEMLAHVITHAASHRGAVGKMLETLGVAGASDMVTTLTTQRMASGQPEAHVVSDLN